jgi:hypothetical protein
VSETAGRAQAQMGNMINRDDSILSQNNTAHILKLFLYFLHLIFPFSLLRPFMALNNKKKQ